MPPQDQAPPSSDPNLTPPAPEPAANDSGSTINVTSSPSAPAENAQPIAVATDTPALAVNDFANPAPVEPTVPDAFEVPTTDAPAAPVTPEAAPAFNAEPFPPSEPVAPPPTPGFSVTDNSANAPVVPGTSADMPLHPMEATKGSKKGLMIAMIIGVVIIILMLVAAVFVSKRANTAVTTGTTTVSQQ